MPKINGPGHLNQTEEEMLKIVAEYFDINHSKNRIQAGEYSGLASKLHHYDFSPFKPVIEKAGNDSDPGLKRMLGGLLSIIIAGYPPLLISDFDRTLTPFTEPLAHSLEHILENNGTFGILTGNIKGAIDKKCMNLKEFNSISGKPELLEHLHLFPKIASEHWMYDRADNRHKLVSASELAEEIGKRDGAGNILPQQQWDTNRGSRQLAEYERILREMVAVFDLEAGGPGYSVAGKLVVDLGSQMDVRVTGEASTDESRNAYVAYEEQDFKERKVYLRELYAAYVNIKTGQFDYERPDGQAILAELGNYLQARNHTMPQKPDPAKKIPMKVRRAGRTNLEGVILGMDKAWALSKIAKLFNQPEWTIIFSGDELEVGGNDWPVLGMASVVLNVGNKIDDMYDDPFFFTSKISGSEGLIKYYNLVGDVLEIENKRRRSSALADRGP